MRLKTLILFSFLIASPAWLGAEDAPSAETSAQHFQAGLAYERLGRLQDAYTELQLACALDDQDVSKALALGVVALRLGRDDVAQRALEHSIALDANSVASYYELALLYEKQKANDRATDSWNRFLELVTDERLKIEARKHLRYLESASLAKHASNSKLIIESDVKRRRLTVILGSIKVLGADNQPLTRLNPLFALAESQAPLAAMRENTQHVVAENAQAFGRARFINATGQSVWAGEASYESLDPADARRAVEILIREQ